MKPLTSLLLALMLASSVGASPSSEEFVIRAIRESEETTVIQEAARSGPYRPLLQNRWRPTQPFQAS